MNVFVPLNPVSGEYVMKFPSVVTVPFAALVIESIVNVSPSRSTSLSITSTTTEVFCGVAALSLFACGASFTGDTVIETVAVSDVNPSKRVYVKSVLPLKLDVGV